MGIHSGDVCDIEKTREARKKAIEWWKKEDLYEMGVFGPPMEL